MAYIGQSIKNGTFTDLSFSGTFNSSTTAFNLGTQVGSPAQLLVSKNGVIQRPGTDYTLATGGTQISFTTAPASGDSIFIVEISGAVGGPMNTDINGAEFILDVDGDTSITADTDDQIDFKTGGSDRLKVQSTSGNNVVVSDGLTLSDGNITFSGSGHGIHLGVTSATAANLLDDSVEGTFTPVFSSSGGAYSITHSGQQGKYTKIGQTVVCHFLCSASGTPSGGSGDFRLTGLPFTPADTSTIPGGHGMVGIINNTNINVDAVQLMFNLGSADTFANLMFITDSSSVTSSSNAPNTIIHANGPRIDGTLVYRTSS